VFQRLRDDHGYRGSYASVHRFVRSLEPPAPDVTIRIERQPGEEAQVDFGYAGLMLDAQGQRHRAWAFVMTLSYSRHQYVEFVFDQTVGTWLLLHQHAFEYFGGAPRKVVLDNLKAGIVQACFDDPQVQRAYRDCAEYYGFLIAPCRVRQPQEKGEVENGVHYVERSFLAGREVARRTDNNVKVLAWVEQIAGLRVHGTTRWQPLVQFQQVERALLRPLPETPFEIASWKQVKLHRDCHIQFERAYYSAPFRYVGQTLWVRGDVRTVRLYADYTLIATHPRATTPGQRATNLDHLPAEKADALTLTPDRCRAEAARLGSAILQAVNQLLDERPLDQLRSVRKLLRLAQTYTPTRLERACVRALRFETVAYLSIKQMLQNGLDAEESPTAIPAPNWPRFARTPQELLAGGE
jgi:transposase